jgi:hypothetical protein
LCAHEEDYLKSPAVGATTTDAFVTEAQMADYFRQAHCSVEDSHSDAGGEYTTSSGRKNKRSKKGGKQLVAGENAPSSVTTTTKSSGTEELTRLIQELQQSLVSYKKENDAKLEQLTAGGTQNPSYGGGHPYRGGHHQGQGRGATSNATRGRGGFRYRGGRRPPRQPRPTDTCHKCGNLGHWANECRTVAEHNLIVCATCTPPVIHDQPTFCCAVCKHYGPDAPVGDIDFLSENWPVDPE